MLSKCYKHVLLAISKRTIVIMIILLFSISALIVPNFFQYGNVENIFIQAASLSVVACGVTFVVLNGGIDFSSTSIIALSSVVGASIISVDRGYMAGNPLSIPVAIMVVLLIGLSFGAINGFAVVVFKMPSFIVTMATMMIGSGMAVYYTKGETINHLPGAFNWIGNGRVLGIPVILFIAVMIVVVLHLHLTKSLFGRQVFAVGTNPKASMISGIQVKNTIFKMFLISGGCASITGILMTSRLQSGAPGLASNMFVDIIASIAIGGTSTKGGSGSIIGTFFGVLFLTTMNNSLNMAGVSWFVIDIIKGLIILTTAIADVVKKEAN